MFARLGHLFLILALFAATGGHWTVLQTVAWTNMFANNLRSDSVATAFTKTFDGKNPCTMCRQISAGKKTEKKTAFSTLAKKLEFVSDRAAFVFRSPDVSRLLPEITPAFAAWIQQPPVPPPRQLPG